MSEQQPELRWAPIPPAPKRRGRIWLIVALSVLAVAIVITLLVLFLPRGGEPEPTATTTSSPSPSATASPTPEPTPTRTPEVSAPPVVDPDLATFAGLVQPRLDDAATGLGFLGDMSGSDAAQIVDQLQQDAERLSDAVAPSSIAADWSAAVADYAAKLVTLRSAVDNGSATDAPLNAATSALQVLRGLVGL